ncbi:MAG TPA: LssY C-terminal domain-containing protein [Candidatus Saccharimonadales bacterium]|nr:LssY C-terminal domain-containing protein [Candidatus Saccharimonadales bacterium]
MIQYFLRGLKRLAVLLPGLIIAYFSVHNIYPFFNKRIPEALAILLTYVLGAYVLAPALVRVYRVLRPPKHLPLYCITPDGFASDPLNIGILCSRRELITAMNDIGWQVADPHTLRNVIREALSVIYEWSYPTAPVSSLYLFGRKQDVAFQLTVEGSPQLRHHVRFWATTYDAAKPLSSRSIDWRHRQAHVQGDNLLWVGAASKDVGISYIRHNFQFTHMIDPDTNQERELIVQQLTKQKLVKKLDHIRLGKPYKLVNRVFRGSLHTDGQMAIVKLK